MGQSANKEYLTIDELLKRWKNAVSRGTLANWRASRRGPGFMTIGRSILYPVAAVEGYERSHNGSRVSGK